MRSPKSDPFKTSPGQAAQRTDSAAKAITAAETDARQTQVARLRAARLERDAIVAILPEVTKPPRKSGRK